MPTFSVLTGIYIVSQASVSDLIDKIDKYVQTIASKTLK